MVNCSFSVVKEVLSGNTEETDCSKDVAYSLIAGAAVIVLFLLVFMLMLISICCLAAKLRSRRARLVFGV